MGRAGHTAYLSRRNTDVRHWRLGVCGLGFSLRRIGRCAGGDHDSYPPFTSSNSSGTHYSVHSGGATVTITCAPSALSSGGAASGSVAYSASLTPVVINLAGTTKANGADNILMGQLITTSLSAGGFQLGDHHWTMGNVDYFHHAEWGPGQSYHYMFGPPSPAWWGSPSLSYYYDADGQELITCTAHVYINGIDIGSVSAEKGFEVWAPYYYFEWTHTYPSYYLPDATSADSIESGGIHFYGAVGTPYLFTQLRYGNWVFLQLCNLDREQSFPYSPFSNTTTTDGFQLDNGWPYAGPWPADSTDIHRTTQQTSDAPSYGFLWGADYFRVEDGYWMFEAYDPPGHPGVGYATEWVPLHYVDWAWTGSATRSGSTWATPSGGTFVNGNEAFPSWRFQWDEIYWNSGGGPALLVKRHEVRSKNRSASQEQILTEVQK